MDTPDLVGLFVRPLEQLEIEYMVTGGVAAVVYGDPRFTRDIDIILKLESAEASRLVGAFDPKLFYVPPVETLRTEARRPRYGHFNIIHRDSALRADVYILSRDPLQQWGFSRRRTLDLESTTISLAPPEYVIVRKLEYYRDSGSDRHLRDIAMILRISEGHVDLPEVVAWVGRLGLEAQWSAARRFDPG
ncbi:MAG TPA: nucleotidyl transferase AbiEii/AbiGii toxin family protein [Longimicrobiales bacterium]|nr:nucleotidyl transferase AbiEii/AbiGii toxin family protein [Longimicrobiales bacterium]